jgi:hypothetical protein
MMKFIVFILMCGIIMGSGAAQKRSPRSQKPMSEYEKKSLKRIKSLGGERVK